VKVDLKGIHRGTTGGHSTTTPCAAAVHGCAESPDRRSSSPPTTKPMLRPKLRTPAVPIGGRFVQGKRLQEARRLHEAQLGPLARPDSDYFGDLRVAQFDRPEKIRPVIRRWRNQWADKPRTADYAMQVLSRVLSHAVDQLGGIASNPCEGIKQLYREATLAHDFADVRNLAFPGNTRRLMDMRRSGVVEAIAGGSDVVGLSAKLANSIGRSNALYKTSAPVEIEAVRKADVARLQGRRKMRAANRKGPKVET
jgi:hypothetical protein